MVEHREDPSALRFLIGHELRVARDRAGLKQADAARVLGCKQPKINYMEIGRNKQDPGEVTKLLRAYGADVEVIDRMASLAARADQGTWWAPFADVLPNWFKTFVGLEGLASAEFTYESLLLPGQLQTEDYATALLVGHLRVPPAEIPQVVRARIARQRVTDQDAPLKMRAVIEQYVLDRAVGGPSVMIPQLEHLLDLIEKGVELHVMPVTTVVHDGLDGDFMLLDFEQARSIGYIEYPNGAIYVQEQDQVELYNLSADRLRNAALTVSETAEFIAGRIAALSSEA